MKIPANVRFVTDGVAFDDVKSRAWDIICKKRTVSEAGFGVEVESMRDCELVEGLWGCLYSYPL